MIVAVPVLLLSRAPGFTLKLVWYISAAAVVVQLALALLLLRREFQRRLNFAAADLAHPPLRTAPEISANAMAE